MGLMQRKFEHLEGEELFSAVQQGVEKYGADYGLEVDWNPADKTGQLRPIHGIRGSVVVRNNQVEVETRASGLAKLYVHKVDDVIRSLLDGLASDQDDAQTRG